MVVERYLEEAFKLVKTTKGKITKEDKKKIREEVDKCLKIIRY